MTTFIVQGCCLAVPPPEEWRERLAQLLGAKPRRIGTWAELALYGALECMAETGEVRLPSDAQIWLGSRSGTYSATGQVLEQMRDDLPMPLTFLQTQPSQVLAQLGARLGWRGHAAFIAGGTPEVLLQLAAANAGAGGLLLGWVDEETMSSRWMRLLPGNNQGERALSGAAELFSKVINCVQVTSDGLKTG